MHDAVDHPLACGGISTARRWASPSFWASRGAAGRCRRSSRWRASLLTAAYSMLRDAQDYRDLGAAHCQSGDHARLVAGLTRRLHHLGYEVTLRPAA
jgi:hypothetical protein